MPRGLLPKRLWRRNQGLSKNDKVIGKRGNTDADADEKKSA
jgi:hypothetical protein